MGGVEVSVDPVQWSAALAAFTHDAEHSCGVSHLA